MKLLVILMLTLFFGHVQAQWSYMNGPYTGGYIVGLDSLNGKLFVATQYEPYGGGVYYSNDNGDSWIECNNGLVDLEISSILVHNSVIYITCPSGIYRSLDEGANWSAANNNVNTTTPIEYLTASGNAVYAGSLGSGVYVSYNNGVSWQTMNNGLNSLYVRCITAKDTLLYVNVAGTTYKYNGSNAIWQDVNLNDFLNCLEIIDDTLYAGSLSNAYISDNHGASWQTTNIYGHYVYDFTVYNGIKYACTNSGIYSVINPLSNWTFNTISIPTNVISHQLYFHGTDVLKATPFGLLRKTVSNPNWFYAHNGLNPAKSSSITYQNGKLYEAGSFLQSTNNGGLNWQLSTNLGSFSGIVKSNQNAVFAAMNMTGQINLYRSLDAGQTWSSISPLNVSRLAVENEVVAFIAAGQPYISIDGGDNFSQGSNVGYVDDIWVIDSVIYVKSFTYGQICRSSDFGINWTVCTGSSMQITSLEKLGTKLYGGAPNGTIYSSDDNGLTWTLGTTNFGHNITSLLENDNVLYAGTLGGGVQRLMLGETDFMPINYGLANLNVLSLIYGNDTIYAGTSKGIWKLAFWETLGFTENDESEIFIYPNPSNGRVKITLPKSLNKIQVINLMGEVKETIDLNFDTLIEIELPTEKGVYLLIFETTDNVRVCKKIVRN